MAAADEVLYLDLPAFIAAYGALVTEKNPLVLTTKKFGERWAVELAIKKGRQSKRARLYADDRNAALKSEALLRKRYKRQLTHVA